MATRIDPIDRYAYTGRNIQSEEVYYRSFNGEKYSSISLFAKHLEAIYQLRYDGIEKAFFSSDGRYYGLARFKNVDNAPFLAWESKTFKDKRSPKDKSRRAELLAVINDE